MLNILLSLFLLPLTLQASSPLLQEARLRAFPVFYMLARAQNSYIGEEISELDHALQTAYHANRKGGPKELIIAGLVHDIGHRLPGKKMDNLGIRFHERLGAHFLRTLGFSDRVCSLVSNHVNAKRYLCAADPQYFETLSEASRQTLAFQGGKMSIKEQREFECNPIFQEIILLRQCEELAKDPDIVVPPLEEYKNMVASHIYMQLLYKKANPS